MQPPYLNYHHLRLFWESARSGSLRAAAEKLRLSQPTISSQIKSLEESLGERLFERSGRGLKLTRTGHLVMDYAGEIFALGAKMTEALGGSKGGRPMRLHIGIADSLPKLVAWRLIRPALSSMRNLQLSCGEGRSADLLGQLASGRLDMLLADEPAPSSLPVKAFSHLLGEAPVVFCGDKRLARKLKPGFPDSLNGAPALLPGGTTRWRHQIDRWFEAHNIRPLVVAEFDDAALMKTAAADGLGFAPIGGPVLEDARHRYGLHPIGWPSQCGFPCYLITVERLLQNPAVATIAREARHVFDMSAKARPARKARQRARA